jgi:hypothetical protein
MNQFQQDQGDWYQDWLEDYKQEQDDQYRYYQYVRDNEEFAVDIPY